MEKNNFRFIESYIKIKCEIVRAKQEDFVLHNNTNTVTPAIYES